MTSVRIYCEGNEKSYDFHILNKIKEGLPTDSILITPIAGKGGGRAVMQFAENQLKKGVSPKTAYFFFFRDRDFDAPVPSTESLIIQGNSYFTYRTTIENYLFDTQLFFEFINQDATRQKAYPDIKNEQDVKQIFIDTAKKISSYQAVRHTLGKMRESIDLGTTWTSGSGSLPEDLSENACRQAALQRINTEKVKIDAWTDANFNQILSEFLSKFNETFFQNLEFLVYFQGKYFAKALTKFALPQFEMDRYYKYALAKFDYHKFADLVELRNVIKDKLA